MLLDKESNWTFGKARAGGGWAYILTGIIMPIKVNFNYAFTLILAIRTNETGKLCLNVCQLVTSLVSSSCKKTKQSSFSLSHQSKDLSVSSQSLIEKADINNHLGSNFFFTQTNNLAQAPMTGGSLKTQD